MQIFGLLLNSFSPHHSASLSNKNEMVTRQRQGLVSEQVSQKMEKITSSRFPANFSPLIYLPALQTIRRLFCSSVQCPPIVHSSPSQFHCSDSGSFLSSALSMVFHLLLARPAVGRHRPRPFQISLTCQHPATATIVSFAPTATSIFARVIISQILQRLRE